MPLDANNVWQYTEGESATTASGMLNRLAGSVSSAIGAITSRLAQTRSWRSVGVTAGTTGITAGTPASVCPAAITIAAAPAGTYLMLGTANAFVATGGAAATVQFRVNAVTVYEPRNDLDTIGTCQMHAWSFEHAGGALTLDYRLLVPGGAATLQLLGSGLVVTRVL